MMENSTPTPTPILHCVSPISYLLHPIPHSPFSILYPLSPTPDPPTLSPIAIATITAAATAMPTVGWYYCCYRYLCLYPYLCLYHCSCRCSSPVCNPSPNHNPALSDLTMRVVDVRVASMPPISYSATSIFCPCFDRPNPSCKPNPSRNPNPEPNASIDHTPTPSPNPEIRTPDMNKTSSLNSASRRW